MTCSSRSTAWLVSVLLAALATAGGQPASAQPPAGDDPAARLAMIEAVRARIAPAAQVRLDEVSVTFDTKAPAAGLVAVPEPGSRVGRIVRFALTVANPQSGGAARRVGIASAFVHVAASHVRAAGAIERGRTLAAEDIVVVDGDLGVMPFATLPQEADVVGSRTVRALRAGEALTASLVKAMPLVRSGETVNVRVRVGAIEAAGRAVAQQSGRRNDRIRLVNPDSRRTMTGRVTGAGEVEVFHEP